MKPVKLLLAVLLSLGAGIQLYAQDASADVSGTYTWTMTGRGGGATRTNILVLRATGERLSGTISMPTRSGPATTSSISEGQVDGTNVSFSVVRTYNGTQFTNRYTGGVNSDGIKGKVEINRNGQPQTRDWNAKRQK